MLAQRPDMRHPLRIVKVAVKHQTQAGNIDLFSEIDLCSITLPANPGVFLLTNDAVDSIKQLIRRMAI